MKDPGAKSPKEFIRERIEQRAREQAERSREHYEKTVRTRRSRQMTSQQMRNWLILLVSLAIAAAIGVWSLS